MYWHFVNVVGSGLRGTLRNFHEEAFQQWALDCKVNCAAYNYHLLIKVAFALQLRKLLSKGWLLQIAFSLEEWNGISEAADERNDLSWVLGIELQECFSRDAGDKQQTKRWWLAGWNGHVRNDQNRLVCLNFDSTSWPRTWSRAAGTRTRSYEVVWGLHI